MPSVPKQLPTRVFWPAALTFVWALLVVPWGLARIVGGIMGTVVFVFGYLVTCFTAGMILTRDERRIGSIFMVTNFVSGFAWVAFALWLMVGVAKNIWH
jgi:hypothetical protein